MSYSPSGPRPQARTALALPSHHRLSDRERALLDFERAWIGRRGGKQAAIATTFGFTPARYYQLIAGLIARDAAERHDPLLVRRLRRRREQRARSTATGRADQRGRGVTK